MTREPTPTPPATNFEQKSIENSVGKILEYFEGELDRVSWYSEWYKKHARNQKIKYLSMRVPIIVLSVTVPQLVTLQSIHKENIFLTAITIISSTLVAVLSALDGFFRWGETYTDDKAAELALYGINRKYAAKRVEFDALPDEQKSEKAKALLDELRDEYEAVVGGATGSFVQRTRTTATTPPKDEKVSGSR
jgi:hypothetical protein